MPATANADPVENRVSDWARCFDRRLEDLVMAAEVGPPAQEGGRPAAGADGQRRLWEAMRYSLLAPGKRLRPYLLCRCCELAGGTQETALPVAAAIECVHAFSLIHDDLPAMDDDDLRRGRPTCHVKFGEALAILAGDGLLALAFELMAGGAADADRAAALTRQLAAACGPAGMIGGQADDVCGEGTAPDRVLTESIHERKTARLFEAACRMGGLAAGARGAVLEALGAYGRELGRAFQIADDLLDVTANADTLGKGVAKDAAAGKQTYPRCVGIEDSRRAARAHAERAVAALASFGAPADDLRELAVFATRRSR